MNSNPLQKLADMETDECLNNNGGCWRDDKTNITACKVIPFIFSSSE
jgi:hypothetical protein